MAWSLRFVLHDTRTPRGNRKERCQQHLLVEPGLAQPAFIRLLLSSPTLLTLLSCCTLALELIAIPVALGCSSQWLLQLLACTAATLHVGVVPALNIVFPFNVFCYALALLPPEASDASCVRSTPGLVAAALLGASSVWSWEDWPLNAMVVFPYNAAQMQAIREQMGKFYLSHSKEKVSNADEHCGPCVVQSCFSQLPAMYVPEVTRALLGANMLVTSRGQGRRDAEVQDALRSYLRTRRRFVDPRTFECFDDVTMG